MSDTQKYEDAGISALFDLSFRRFVTLNVIKVLYLLGLVMIALFWLIGVGVAFSQGGAAAGFGMMITMSILALLQIVFYRVWLELIVVIFRIGENTSKLVEQGRGLGGAAPTTPPQ